MKTKTGPVLCRHCFRTFPRESVVQIKTPGRGGNYYLCRMCADKRQPPKPAA